MNPVLTSVSWWRTYLKVSIDDAAALPALAQDDVIREFAPEGTQGASFSLNISNAAGRDLLESGTWTFIDARSGQPLVPADVIMASVEDFTRSFFFAKGSRLYSVRFIVAGTEDSPELGLVVSYYRQDDHPRRDMSLTRFAKRGLNLFYKAASLVHKKRGNRVLFMSENNSAISGNLAAIDRRMKERGLDERFDVSYSFRNIFNGSLKPLQWLAVLNAIAKQDVIFVEDYVPVFAAIDLSPDTELVQVWHAGFGFKAVGFGRFGIDESPNPFASCHRKYTYALVGNPGLREIYSEVFGIEERALLATGMPRLDHFLDPGVARAAKDRFVSDYPSIVGKRVVLFAPTYRGKNQKEAHYDFCRVDSKMLYEWCLRTNSAVVFKMHRFITDPVPIPDEYRDRFVDASHDDINDLFYSTDILITDYSSCFYDYLLLDRPVVFYCYDEAFYQGTRGVHRPVSAVAPGPVCSTFPDVVNALDDTIAGARATHPAGFLVDRCAEGGMLASDAVIDTVLLGKYIEGVCLR